MKNFKPKEFVLRGEMEGRDWPRGNNSLELEEPGLDEIIEPVENRPMVRGVQESK